jgi:hypothetical protein
LATALVLVLHNTVIEAYRVEEPFLQNRYYSKLSPYLKGVRMSYPLATNIDAIISELHKSGFDPELDRVMAYVDVPGFVAVTGAQSFGIAWGGCDADHPGSTNLMNRYLDLEPYSRPIRYVYVVINHDIDPGVRARMNELLKPGPGFRLGLVGVPGRFCVHLGHFRDYQMVFEGPYLFSQNRQ